MAKKITKKKEIEKLGKKERIEILKKFTKEAIKKYGSVIRSIVLFGSTARAEFKGESDIDIFVIIDDTKQKMTPELKERIEFGLDDIAKGTHKLLSMQQPYTLTEFWRLVRMGHPIVFNFIREGVPIYDKDIFLPIKRLLQMGEIRPSEEAVEKFIERGPKRIKRVESAKMYMVVEDCYYAMLESAQAVLMFMGKYPPRPNETPSVLRKTVVKMKLLDETFVKYLEDVIEIRKKVEHKKLKEMSGNDVDEWIEKTKKFVKKMKGLLAKIEVLKRENMVEKSYVIMEETIKTILKTMDKTVPMGRLGLNKSFEKDLIKTGLVPNVYSKVNNDLEKMHNLVKKGKIMEIQKQDILINREYVRKFIREAGKLMKQYKK
ncbi:MAG: nucleotidyltransferase domain-containing protein [Candidatus Aenigmarchaeota archaeon]|nr:nucleotidyltransferase domain-containing protein [Candidatus Aenigmarchaeota archaeon]